MKIIAVDDDRLSLELIGELIKDVMPTAELQLFTSAMAASDYLSFNECDVVFLDICMNGMTGMELALRLRLSRPGVNVIFVTGSEEYALQALELHASGYVVKPVTLEKIRRELSDLRYSGKKPEKRVRVQCFGNFEVFVDGRAVRFKYKKTRELLAYLVDRCGSICSGPEITATLWEEDMEEHQSYLKSLVRDLTHTLATMGCENIIEKQWGGLGIRTDLIECDYYNWKRGIGTGINTYRGEYMSQYSWGEFTNANQMGSTGLL